jgi:hypothetical protein
VDLDDFLAGSQAYPGPAKFSLTMQPFKRFKNFIKVDRVNPDAVVLYPDNEFIGL